MLENEEAFYSTYVMLLKQGLDFPGNFVVKPWGLSAVIKPAQQQDFFDLCFREHINSPWSNTAQCSILVIGKGRQYQYKKKRSVFWKVLSGKLVCRHVSIRSRLLLPGDDLVAARSEQVLHNTDSPTVVLQLEID